MTIKLEAASTEGYNDELGELAFRVTVQDENCALITLSHAIHTAESWRETAEQIGRAIEMLKLED